VAVNQNTIWIVGCGPGGPEYLTREAEQVVARSEIVFGSRRLLQLFSDSDTKQVQLPARSEEAIRTIDQHDHRGPVAVLVSGDPGVFSLAGPLVKHFGPERCVTVPGISSVQVAFSRLYMSWIDARIISVHGIIPEVSLEELVDEDKIAFLVGTGEAVEWVFAMAEKLSATHTLFACENLSLPNEVVQQIDPSGFPPNEIASLALLILVRRSETNDGPDQESQDSMREKE